MCQQCDKSGITSVEPYEADDDEFCEFMEDADIMEEIDDGPLICDRRPCYLIVETTVEDHLCSRHAKLAGQEDAEEELFGGMVGLDCSTIVPVEEEYQGLCEYFDPLDPKSEACSERATQARLLEFETLFCEEHFKRIYEGEIQ